MYKSIPGGARHRGSQQKRNTSDLREDFMKRVFVLLAASAVIISFNGCGKKEPAQESSFNVVASFYPVYIIAKNLTDGISGVTLTNMTPPVTGCLHDYSITTDDMKKLENADLFLANGAGMESFMDKITAKYPSLKKGELSKGIKLIVGEEGENPHVWVSVAHAITMTHNCADVLTAADPSHEKKYRANEEAYASKLEALELEMKTALAPYRGRKIVTFHEAFPYFAKEFGLEIAAVVEREPGTEPSAKELAETITLVRKSGIKILFAEPQYPSISAKAIARETGAVIFTLDPAVTGEDDRDAYISIMKQNLVILKEAFK